MEQKWKILAIVISIILIAGLSYFIINMVLLLPPERGSTRVDTITIEKDEDFIKYDFPGTGTFQDPFRIENIELGTYEYVLRERYKLIAIKNTTVHVLIQNCTFIGCEFGVYIDSVNEGFIHIRNNTFIGTESRVWDVLFSGSISIGTTKSENISMSENIFMGKIRPAIHIHQSSNIIISKNKILLDDYGAAIGFDDSLDIVLDGNLVLLDSSSPTVITGGVYFKFTQNCSITNNVINNVTISFLHCNDLEIRNNTLESEIEETTLLWFVAENVEIIQNNFLGTEHYGIAGSGLNFIISNNTFDVGTRGLYVKVQHVVITYNSFYNSSGYAISIDYYASNLTIYHNNFFDNHLSGYSQCYDEYPGTLWYNTVLSEGNYWSNLGSNTTYSIAGPAGSVDLFPLINPIDF